MFSDPDPDADPDPLDQKILQYKILLIFWGDYKKSNYQMWIFWSKLFFLKLPENPKICYKKNYVLKYPRIITEFLR